MGLDSSQMEEQAVNKIANYYMRFAICNKLI